MPGDVIGLAIPLEEGWWGELWLGTGGWVSVLGGSVASVAQEGLDMKEVLTGMRDDG